MLNEESRVLQLVRGSHEARVLATLRARGALDRAALQQATGLSRTTLSTIVRDLFSRGALTESSRTTSDAEPKRGRPPSLIGLNPASGSAVGIDLASRWTRVVVANVAHETIGSARVASRKKEPLEEQINAACELLDKITSRAGISLANLGGIGVGVVGPIAEDADAPINHADLAHTMLSDRFDVPIHVDNNSRLAALAEAIWGAGDGVRNMIYIRLSYGIGGGLVLDGRLFSGTRGAAGQFGFVSADTDGRFGEFAAIDAVLARCGVRTLGQLFSRLEEGDSEVLRALADVGKRLGRTLAAACNVVNPDAVVVGGELMAAGDALLGPARAALLEATHPEVRRGLAIRTATLDEYSSARGAVTLVLHESALLAQYTSAGDTAGATRTIDVAAARSRRTSR